jgi:hypothetical protein
MHSPGGTTLTSATFSCDIATRRARSFEGVRSIPENWPGRLIVIDLQDPGS